MALDNRLLHFSSSNREAPSNYHFFFILFSESVRFHVRPIQMVGMIIGPPNIMQPIFACYFAHVCSGVQHPLGHNKGKKTKENMKNKSDRVTLLSWNHSDGFY